MRCRSRVAQTEAGKERRSNKGDAMLLSALRNGLGLCQSFLFSEAGALAAITCACNGWVLFPTTVVLLDP
jgi:hypothetical protein